MLSNFLLFSRLKFSQSTQCNATALIGKFNYFSTDTEASVSSKTLKSSKVVVDKRDKKDKRIFTAFFPDLPDCHGRYVGQFPRTAATKALSSFVRTVLKEKDHVEPFNFTIQEITAGSANKVYKYSGSRCLLPVPKIRTVKNKKGEPVTITSKFKYSVIALRNTIKASK